MWFVGIDWAGDHHDVAVTDEGAGLLARFRVAHSVAGLEELVARVAALGADRGEVRVALERPDGLLVANLLERGYAVYPVNPKAVDRYRDRHQGSGAKDDARDAWVLANILRTDGHRFAPLGAEGEVAAELRLTARAHRDLVQEGTRLANQLHAALADYYPAAPTLFGQLAQPVALAFLQAFPTAEAARAAGRAGILAWCKAHRYQPRWAEALWEKLDAPALAQPNAGVVRARSRQVPPGSSRGSTSGPWPRCWAATRTGACSWRCRGRGWCWPPSCWASWARTAPPCPAPTTCGRWAAPPR